MGRESGSNVFLEGNVLARDAGVYLSGSLLSDGVEHLLVCPVKFCSSICNQQGMGFGLCVADEATVTSD